MNNMLEKTVHYSGEYIWVRPLCDFFGLSERHQYRKIKDEFHLITLGENENLRTFSDKSIPKNENLRTFKYAEGGENTPEMQKKYAEEAEVIPNNGNLVEKSQSVYGIIDRNGRILLSKKGFLRWVWGLNPEVVKEELRESLITYQDMIHEYLFSEIRKDEELGLRYNKLNQIEEEISTLRKQARKEKELIEQLMAERYGQLSLTFEETQELPA